MLIYRSKCDYRGTELNKQTKLINALEVAHIKDLKKYFFYYDDKEHPLNKDEFIAAICSVTGKYIAV